MADPSPSRRTPRRYLQQFGQRLEIIGVRPPGLRDVYHYMVGATWGRVVLVLFACFLGVNTLFATIYMLIGGIEGARPGQFSDAFFFSVQTIGTIGYGVMYPKTLTAHLVVTSETMVGMMSMAIITGLVFAKFSRPTARVMFSQVACIALRDGVPTLMFRVANERNNSVVEATMRVSLLRNERTKEGEFIRKIYDVPLLRSTSPAFILSWTALHQIVPGSPLYGLTQEDLEALAVQIQVTLIGLDETIAQNIHARYSYQAKDLRWDVRLDDVIIDVEGRRVVDYTRFHDVVPIEGSSVRALVAPGKSSPTLAEPAASPQPAAVPPAPEKQAATG